MSLALLTGACGGGEATPTPTGAAGRPAKVLVFHQNSPNVSIIDTTMNVRDKRVAVAGLKAWGWVDDRNYYDGTNLWLPALDADTGEAQVVLMELETFFIGISPTITKSIPLGEEDGNVFISRISQGGRVFVALQNAGEVVVIDGSTQEIVGRVQVDQMACGLDIAVGADGKERVYRAQRRCGHGTGHRHKYTGDYCHYTLGWRVAHRVVSPPLRMEAASGSMTVTATPVRYWIV